MGYIENTIGEGGQAFVKRGRDKYIGKEVALKVTFVGTHVDLQRRQARVEVDAANMIRHPNVLRMWAYNYTARYPQKELTREAILLVLDYMPHGDLFDILFRTGALHQIVARTLFKQIIRGLAACHDAGIVHRDMKPQNLLLDKNFNIKIADFGLAKITEPNADAVMTETRVGTKGYQAPELLLRRAYDHKCDVFSVGVILFIMLTGYPPFENASVSDPWFKPLLEGKVDKFWRAHRHSAVARMPVAMDLINKMLCADPAERIDIAGIMNHAWFQDKILRPEHLKHVMQLKYDQAAKHKANKKRDLAKKVRVKKSINIFENGKY